MSDSSKVEDVKTESSKASTSSRSDSGYRKAESTSSYRDHRDHRDQRSHRSGGPRRQGSSKRPNNNNRNNPRRPYRRFDPTHSSTNNMGRDESGVPAPVELTEEQIEKIKNSLTDDEKKSLNSKDLKSKKIEALTDLAIKLQVEHAAGLRRQDFSF